MKHFISTKEAVKLSSQTTVYMINDAHEIYEGCIKKFSAMCPGGEEANQFAAIGAVFLAGRIAGIRQERERRKARTAK